MHVKAICSVNFLTFILCGSISLFPNPRLPVKVPDNLTIPVHVRSTNHPPAVNFIQPLENAVYAWNTVVPYSVEVSDAEDGESKYQEIPSTEVVVKLKFVRDAAKATAYLKQKKFSDTAGLSGMVVSNCFSCHAVKSKIAGPSFQEINMRYRQPGNSRDQLVNHIRNGSSGIWGKEVMPTHPELTDTAAGQMVKWILTYANDPGLDYFIGLQGAAYLKKPTISASKGVYILMAYYTDHGTTDNPGKKITGSDQRLVHMK